ncbi:carboxylate-amine ligase [Thalassoglobus polymorphus]|uniref:Putative glutamate--cysteine ligase 2 n=1 Tax=Thalassoglobus polymorphus TaxID=2527994 RepID=A0A517QK56_9PLAN|nr:YbdK family carboxylate-amine ligase [Thalassoglobus polymorphus]QDT32026.1 Carboxylate-amine ligase YbdK [Thalassoglobus polymorphus]
MPKASKKINFSESPGPSLGVEVELALVDKQTGALRSACPGLIQALSQNDREAAKPELMECYVEINTEVCQSVGEAHQQLRSQLKTVQSAADTVGIDLLWSGTHPFSSWQNQQVSNKERYNRIVSLLQDTARQLVTFGLHVHVGVDSGDKAVMICDRILKHLPELLAASCNSPFWEGRDTGLCSWRTKVMEGLPTAGLPPFMRNWSEYAWLINHLIDTGFIETIREIWWDVRPHHNFGTVEIRICDMPGQLDDAMGLVAYVHCLVKHLSDAIDEGLYQHDCHPMLVRQNKWRAARYGLDAELVDSITHELVPARKIISDTCDRFEEIAQELNCVDELKEMKRFATERNWSQRQLDQLNDNSDPQALVQWMVKQSRIE